MIESVGEANLTYYGLLTCWKEKDRKKFHLQGCCTELMASSTLGDFREVVDQPLKYVSSIQVTVIVHIDVYYTLGI